MIIDAHGHACGYYCKDTILSYMKAKGIDKVILCPGKPKNDKTYSLPMFSNIVKSEHLPYRINRGIRLITTLNRASDYIDKQNRMIGGLHLEYPNQIIQCYQVNPLDGRYLRKLEGDFLRYRFPMVKLHQSVHRFSFDDVAVGRIVRWCEGRNIPLFVHLHSKEQVLKFIDLANQYPDVSFIVAHLIGFYPICKGRKYHNIYFDISMPQIYQESVLTDALRFVGCDYLILGSNMPYGGVNLADNINNIKRLIPEREQREKIYWRNVTRLMDKALLHKNQGR